MKEYKTFQEAAEQGGCIVDLGDEYKVFKDVIPIKELPKFRKVIKMPRLPRKLKKKLKKENPNWNKYMFWKSQFRLPDPNYYSRMYEGKFETGLDKINTDINVFENPIGTCSKRLSFNYSDI